MNQRVSGCWLLLSLLFTLVHCQACDHPYLPTSLNDVGYLEAGQVHVASHYRTDFMAPSQFTSVSVEDESFMRIYAAPSDVDIYITLYDSLGSELETAVGGSKLEKTLFATLMPDEDYVIEWAYVLDVDYELEECECLFMELEVMPKTVIPDTVDVYQCPVSSSLPPSNLFSNYRPGYGLDFGGSYVVVPDESAGTGSMDADFFWYSSFTVPEGTEDLWHVRVTLEFDFFTGGSLGAFIAPSDRLDPPSLFCQYSTCSTAVGSQMNTKRVDVELGPGDYTLMLFDALAQDELELSPCSEFYLHVQIDAVVEAENTITCPEQWLPPSLNLPGFLTQDGFLQWSSPMYLDFGVETVVTTTLQLEEASFVRILVEESDIDVDVSVRSTTAQIAVSDNFDGAAEGILLHIGPGMFYIDFTLAETAVHDFCHTFDLVMAVAPATSLSTYCSSTTGYAPDFSDMQTSLDGASQAYHLATDPHDPYEYYYSQTYTQQEVASADFNIAAESYFIAEVGMNFLIGDMTMTITHEDGSVVYADHFANVVILKTILPPGDYHFSILTGVIQSGIANTELFSDCALYTVGLAIKSVASVEIPDCIRYPRLPETLNSPSFLSSMQWVSIDSDFQGPGRGATHETTISVKENAFFRAEAAFAFGIGTLELYDGDIIVASDLSGATKQLDFTLIGGEIYTLAISGDASGACSALHLEVGITPVHTDEDDAGCITYQPHSDIFEYDELPYYYVDSYSILQPIAGSDYSWTVEFTITEEVYFRAELMQDFLSSNITLYLWGNQDIIPQTDQHVRLFPGDYSIELYEDGADEVLHECAFYSLQISMASTTPVEDRGSELDCSFPYLPVTLDSVGFMTDVSGNQLHFQESFLVDVAAGRSVSSLFIAGEYEVHAFVDGIEHFDLSIGLVDSSMNVMALSDRSTTGAESFSVTVYEGEYYLYLLFNPSDDLTPTLVACPTYDLELQVVPTSFVDTVSETLADSCHPHHPPSALIASGEFVEFTHRYQYFRQGGDNVGVIELDVQSSSYVYIEIGYEFTLGSFQISIESQESGLVIPAVYFQGGAFVETNLLVGSYSIVVADVGAIDGSPQGVCIEYDVKIVLGDKLSLACTNVHELPSDLFSEDGGSGLYGGPQNDDTGRVVVGGVHFKVPSLLTREVIAFKVPIDSFMRVYVDAGHDVTVIISVYDSADRTSALQPVLNEQHLYELSAQEDLFYLELFFVHIETSDRCATYAFQVELKSQDDIAGELSCPMTLPDPAMPESGLSLGSDGVAFGKYVFDSELLDHSHVLNFGGESYWYYPMEIDVRVDGTIHTYVEYDMIVGDVRLMLGDENMRVIAFGDYQLVANHEEDFNIRNGFVHQLGEEEEVGTLTLYFLQSAMFHPFDLDSFCVPFQFSLSYSTQDGPYLMFVDPPGGTDFSSLENFVVTMVFSDEVAYPEQANLLSFSNEHDAIYLVNEANEEDVVYPSVMQYLDDGMAIATVFAPGYLQMGATYELRHDASVFLTSGGESFADDSSSSYVYSFAGCSCNGHGECSVENGQIVCNCMEGYTGDECENCSSGYHGAGGQCVLDTACEADSCNNHGTCKDHNGYFHCNCDEGWATTGDEFCSICAHGYTLDNGDCVRQNDAADHPIDCSAPLLPSNFDTMQYMGYNGAMHLVNDFFVDPAASRHEILLSLQTDSLFRLSVESVDVEVNLSLVSNDDSRVIVEDTSGSSFSHTIIYESGNDSGSYTLIIDFLSISVASTCPTIHLEAASSLISDLPSAICIPSDDSYPQIQETAPAVIDDTFSYMPAETFSVGAGVEDHYFYSFSFTIGQAPANTEPVVSISVAYEFLLGEIMIVLEKSNCDDCGDHCISEEQEGSCITSQSQYNRHLLQASVADESSYVLWLYLPAEIVSSVSDCIEFELEFLVTFNAMSEDSWNCDAPRPPEDLTSPLFLDADGDVHLVESYFIPSSGSEMAVSVDTGSLFRIVVRAESPTQRLSISYKLSSDDDFTSVTPLSDGSISSAWQLGAGDYVILIESFSTSSIGLPSEFCEMVNMEVSIVALREDYPCSGSSTSLPSIASEDVTVGYSYGVASDRVPPMTFTAYFDDSFNGNIGEVIYSLDFTLGSSSVFTVGVASSFAEANLYTELYNTEGLVTQGRNAYNYNLLEVLLAPGIYHLNLKRDSVYPPTAPISCADFSFELTLLPAEECLLTGEPVPSNLNTLRFLASSSSVHFISDSVRVPDFMGESTSIAEIDMVPGADSIFRAYVDPLNNVKVKLEILTWVNGVYSSIVSSVDDVKGPQMVTLAMDAYLPYMLRIKFTSRSTTPVCPTVLLEFALSPLSALSVDPVCPGSTGHFVPKIPDGTPETPYYYDSEEIEENLYYQNRLGTRVYHFTELELDEAANIHFEVGYDFILADVNIYLASADDDNDYLKRGVHSFNTAIVHAVNVPPGSYRLTLFQAGQTPDVIDGCVYFSSKIIIEPYEEPSLTPSTSTYLPIPVSLDGISYLGFNDRFQLVTSNIFEYAVGVPFTVTSASFLRVNSFNSEGRSMTLGVRTAGGTLVSSSTNTYFTSLDEGSYYIVLTPHDEEVDYSLQLSMDTYDRVVEDMQTFSSRVPSCSTTLWPPATYSSASNEGYYYSDLQATAWSPSSDGLIATSTVNLVDTSAYVYVHIGFQFLVADLSLQLEGEDGLLSITSESGLNQAELYVLLPPGTYTLSLHMGSASDYFLPSHCVGYSMVMAITNQGDRPDCYNYLSLPVDMSTHDGGSAMYGGPMSASGTLDFYGPSFTYSAVPQHTSHVNFESREDSIISVFTNSHVEEAAYVDFSLFEYMVDSSYIDSIYSVTPIAGGPYKQRIFNTLGHIRYYDIHVYDGLDPSVTAACPTYALDMQVATLTTLQSRLSCQASPSLPSTTVETADGVAYDWRQSTYPYFLVDTPYSISFELDEESVFVARFSFDTLLVSVNLVLNKGMGHEPLAVSTLAPETIDGDTNTVATISTTLEAGSYSLIINGENYNTLINATSSVGADGSCFPYTWSLQIFPVTENPYVVTVDPSSQSSWPIDEDLTLHVTFSSSLYSVGQPLTNLNKDRVIQALYLLSGEDEEDYVMPSSAFTVGSSRTVWRIVFGADNLSPGDTYRFGIHPGILTDHDYLSVIVPGTYLYKIRIECSGAHQHYTDDFDCVCDTGFAGDHCDICDTGYFGPSCLPDTCSPECVHGTCSEAVCTCDHGWDGEGCTYCATHFTGDDCDECVDRFDGYDCDTCQYPFTGLPDCDQCAGNYDGASCSYCKLGYEIATGCVDCAEHFTGENCDECVTGWAGVQCDHCGDRFDGSDCEVCATNWTGDDCTVCPQNYQENPGNCALCNFNWQGANCDECAEGFTGPDCTSPDLPPTQSSGSSDNHHDSSGSSDDHHDTSDSSDSDSDDHDETIGMNNLGQRITILCLAVALLLLLLCLAFSLVAFICYRKRRGRRGHDRTPVLDLDEEDAVELDSNPMAFSTQTREGDENSLLQFSWGNDSENMNTVGTYDDGLSLDDTYDGAIDLENLDEYSPAQGAAFDDGPSLNDEFLDDDFNPRL